MGVLRVLLLCALSPHHLYFSISPVHQRLCLSQPLICWSVNPLPLSECLLHSRAGYENDASLLLLGALGEVEALPPPDLDDHARVQPVSTAASHFAHILRVTIRREHASEERGRHSCICATMWSDRETGGGAGPALPVGNAASRCVKSDMRWWEAVQNGEFSAGRRMGDTGLWISCEMGLVRDGARGLGLMPR